MALALSIKNVYVLIIINLTSLLTCSSIYFWLLGKSAFHLDGECGLYNNHGTRVESDQVLDLLEKSGYIMFFIREIDIHEQIITHDVPEMPEPAQQPNVFVDPSPSTSSAESSQVETTVSVTINHNYVKKIPYMFFLYFEGFLPSFGHLERYASRQTGCTRR